MKTAALPVSRTRIEGAKARFTIPVLWSMFNLPGKPAKSCHSPFREDRCPSFSVSEDGFHWIDFATGERGDTIEFLAKLKSISNTEAFVELLRMVDGPANIVRPTRSPEAKPRALHRRPDLSGIEPCAEDDLNEISKLRSIPIEGLKLAANRKLLFAYVHPYQGRCFVITDDARRSAIARRLDGERFHYREATAEKTEGPKSRNWKNSEANWPIGIAQSSRFPAIALCEGMPDFLAAFALAYDGAVERLVAPVCMTGASCSPHKDALPLFRGKRVRIFGHADEAGQNAMSNYGVWRRRLTDLISLGWSKATDRRLKI